MAPFVIILIGVALIALVVREYWLFDRLPAKADAARARGDRTEAICILERLLAQPPVLGTRSRTKVHHRLAWLYLQEGRAQEAVDQARKSLAGTLHPAMESIHRMILADCLEAAGDADGARVERDRARRLVASGPENAAQLLALGKTLRKEGRYTESIPIYERAIVLAQGMAPLVRTHLMVSLALSCWEAGRIADALSWADQALRLQPDLTQRISAYSVSALALGNLGRLDDAENRWNLALNAATEAGNTTQAARYLALLAEVQRRRGKLVDAIETCRRAAGMSLKSRRSARFVEFEVNLTWGRFSDAREALEQGAKAHGFAVPSTERRILSVVTMNVGLLAAEEGAPDQALALMDEVRSVLEADEKIGLTYLVLRAWIEATLGLMAESERSAQAATILTTRRGDDRAALLRYHTYLGRAALAAGRPDTARHHFSACQTLGPDPSERPRVHYFLGETCRAMGDHAGAVTYWQAAVGTGLDTRYVRLAEKRLQEPAQPAAAAGKEA